MLRLVLLLCLIVVSKTWTSKCGYESCNKERPEMINVHIIPHTHADPGWTMTVDQYYYKFVQFILDSVMPELKADPNRRFIFVEMSYFSRWFEEQNNETRALVQELVDEGRLEFILGGWVMNDEATTHYTAIIDQHKLGFEYLRNTFGQCAIPKIGWQIDPFGHSREQASLFAQFGFDGLFFGRLDEQDKDQRKLDKRLEFVWRGSPSNLGRHADLFTGVLPNGYDPPRGYNFDLVSELFNVGDLVTIKDNLRLRDYNVDAMVDGFIRAVREQAAWYASNHLIITFGSDFNYVSAHMNFKEMDKLIKYVNDRQANGSNINLLYSTPSCYLKELHNDNRTWSSKEDDFFPYANNEHSFWTGFYTSRPTLKYYSRVANSFFQFVKRLSAFSKLHGNYAEDTKEEDIQLLAEVVALAQHHDAITGTQKQVVAFDYAERLAEGISAGYNVINEAYRKLMSKNGTEPAWQTFCPSLNISVCNITESSNHIQVTIFNPLERNGFHIVRIPVNGDQYVVYSSDGVSTVPSDLVPHTLTAARSDAGRGLVDTAKELVFAAHLPALGISTYFVEALTTNETSNSSRLAELSNSTVIEGKYVRVTFDNRGCLSSMTNIVSGITTPLQQNFLYYKEFVGDSSTPDRQASGAYIFRPEDNNATRIPLTTGTSIRKGALVQEAYQQFSDWISQVVRVYQDKPYVEVEWSVGPIPISDDVGKDVITRYSLPGWGNNGVFYTDSNGREILERRLNQRPTWQLNLFEPVAGNYYPVDSLLGIKNANGTQQFTILTDRAQGGSSLRDGDVELMLHRRMLVDDHRGVWEALNETGSDGRGLIAKGKHYLLLETTDKAARQYRTLAQDIFLHPQLSFSDLNIAPGQYVSKFQTQVVGLNVTLPENIHLLSLEQFHGNGPVHSPSGTVPFLVRLEHFYEVGEDKDRSQPITFDIEKSLFSGWSMDAAYELSLGGNVPVEQIQRLQWRTQDDPDHLTAVSPPRRLRNSAVTLGPMEIITLQVNIRMW